MDKTEARPFDWVPRAMPAVARLVREKRAEWGDAHVNLCWQRGVIEQQAGWFFARERSIALGVPWDMGPAMSGAIAQPWSSTQALLLMRDPSFPCDAK